MEIRTWMRNLVNTVIPEIISAQVSDKPTLYVPKSQFAVVDPIYNKIVPTGAAAESEVRLGMVIDKYGQSTGFIGDTISGSSRDVGYDISDYQRRYKAYRIEYAEAAKSGKALPEPPEPSLTPSMPVRTISRTGNANTPTPPIDVPGDRFNRATLALNYFKNDAIVGTAVRALYEFVIGPGFEVEPQYNFEDLPEWFDVNAPWVASIKGKNPGRKSTGRDTVVFHRYLTQQAKDLKDHLNMESFALELARDALVTGDGFGFRIDDIQNDSYVDNREPKAEIDYIFNNPHKIQSINPLAVDVELDEAAEIVSYTFKPMGATGAAAGKKVSGDELARVIRLKWGGSGWSLYGESILGNVLAELSLKDSLMNAMKISADRFIVPIKIAKFGEHHSGPEGGPMATPSMRDDLASVLRVFDPRTGQWILGPYHWTLEYLGTENGVLSVSTEIGETNTRIMQGIGIPPNFIDASYTSFATAKVQFSYLLQRLRLLQVETAEALENGILIPWAEMRGFRDPVGNLIKFKVTWRKPNLEGDPEMLSTIRTLAVSTGQNVLSDATMTEALGFNSDLEQQRLEAEYQLDQERLAEQGLGPDGQPSVDENGDPVKKGPGTPNERGTPEDDASQLPSPKRKKGPTSAASNPTVSRDVVLAAMNEINAKQNISTESLLAKFDEMYQLLKKDSKKNE